MSKGILGNNSFAYLEIDKTTANEDNDTCTEIDLAPLGMPQNGTLLIGLDYSTDHVTALQVWTSSLSGFTSDATAMAADTNTIQVAITSDVDNLKSMASNTSDMYDVSVSSNTISDLKGRDGLTVINCKSLRRYLSVQFDAGSTGSGLTVMFIGHDLNESPAEVATTAY